MSADIVLIIFEQLTLFGRDIYNGKITLKEADGDQSNLRKKKQDHRIRRKSKRNKIFLKTYMHSLRVEKESLILLKAKYFQLNLKVEIFQTRSLTILISNLTPEQMLQ